MTLRHLFWCLERGIRTPEQKFSPENFCEAVPRAKRSDGDASTRGSGIGSEAKMKAAVFIFAERTDSGEFPFAHPSLSAKTI